MNDNVIPQELIELITDTFMYEVIKVNTDSIATTIWLIPLGDTLSFTSAFKNENISIQVLGTLPLCDDARARVGEYLNDPTVPSWTRVEWARQLIDGSWPISFGSEEGEDDDEGANAPEPETDQGAEDGSKPSVRIERGVTVAEVGQTPKKLRVIFLAAAADAGLTPSPPKGLGP